MKHLLLICYFFPPDGGGGTQRPLSIATHARACAWRVTVLTRDVAAKRGVWDPQDDSLPSGNDTVVRVPVPAESRAAEMTPPRRGVEDPWLHELAREAEALHGRDPFDHVLITMPPYGLAPVLPLLRERLRDVPVSVDLRDPWALDGAYAYPHWYRWKQNLGWMDRTVRRADGVVVNTREMRSEFARRYPDIEPDRITAVPNGYEPELFRGPIPARPAEYEEGCFHLVHVGTLHSRAWVRNSGWIGRLRKIKTHRAEPIDVKGRTVVPLLEAIRKLEQRGTTELNRLRLVLVGVDDPETRQLIESHGVSSRVVLTGYRPHEQAVAWMRWAQCLFLPLHGLPKGYRSLIVPGKTYEYLASGRPILACLPEGDARDMVASRARAVCAPPTDADQIADRLLELMSPSRAEELSGTSDPPDMEAFGRRCLTRRLMRFLEKVGSTRRKAAAV